MRSRENQVKEQHANTTGNVTTPSQVYRWCHDRCAITWWIKQIAIRPSPDVTSCQMVAFTADRLYTEDTLLGSDNLYSYRPCWLTKGWPTVCTSHWSVCWWLPPPTMTSIYCTYNLVAELNPSLNVASVPYPDTPTPRWPVQDPDGLSEGDPRWTRHFCSFLLFTFQQQRKLSQQ